MTRTFTGRHMATILLSAFAVVLAVNLLLARLAGSTFGGEVVENSYVASQHFNRWLDESERERRLGWQAQVVRLPDNRLEVALTGAPENAVLTAIARHPLGRLPDIPLTFGGTGSTRFESGGALPPGRWRLRLEVRSGSQIWHGETDVR